VKWLIQMPLAITLPRKTKADKRYIINLNNYRNWHRMVESHIKKAYSAIAVERILAAGVKIPDGSRAIFVYRMYKGSARKIDRANVLCIHQKYFEDAMTAAGAYPDDNDDWIEMQGFRSGGLDRANPRVEIEISVNSTRQPMLF